MPTFSGPISPAFRRRRARPLRCPLPSPRCSGMRRSKLRTTSSRATGRLSDPRISPGASTSPEGENFVPVSLFFPPGANIPAGRNVKFFGVVENAAGEIVQILEEEATLIASARDVYVDRTITLAPGQYKAAFGVAADGQTLALTPAELTVHSLNAEEPAISAAPPLQSRGAASAGAEEDGPVHVRRPESRSEGRCRIRYCGRALVLHGAAQPGPRRNRRAHGDGEDGHYRHDRLGQDPEDELPPRSRRYDSSPAARTITSLWSRPSPSLTSSRGSTRSS